MSDVFVVDEGFESAAAEFWGRKEVAVVGARVGDFVRSLDEEGLEVFGLLIGLRVSSIVGSDVSGIVGEGVGGMVG